MADKKHESTNQKADDPQESEDWDSGRPHPASGLTVDVDQALVRVRELSEQFLEQSQDSGLAWLQTYEHVLDSLLKLQKDAAASTQVEWVNTLASTSADFVREVSGLYLDAVKSQLNRPATSTSATTDTETADWTNLVSHPGIE